METFLSEILFIRKKTTFFSCVLTISSLISLSSFAQSPGWVQKQSLYISALPRTEAVGFSIGNKGYIGLGAGNYGSDNLIGAVTFNNDFWEFDPVTNVWTQKASYPGAGTLGSVGFSIGTKGYNGTGSGTNDFWEYKN